METIDLIGYSIIIVVVVLLIYIEANHFVCDSLTCSMYLWSKKGAMNDRDFYKRLIEGQTRQSVWMRCFYLAAIITFIVYWWFYGRLPPVIYFIALLTMIFVVIYFGLVFYQHHFLRPINIDLKRYIDASCSKEDQR